MKSRRAVFTAVAVLLCSTCCLAESKKILMIAGPRDHGGPGAHEYEKDLRLLKRCLDTSPNVKGVSAEVMLVKQPRDIARLNNIATIVIHSSGDQIPKETHSIFPSHNGSDADATYSKADARYTEQLDRLMKQGSGIVVLHYSLIVANPRSQSYLLDWIGGYHRAGYSQVKIDRGEATPVKTAHPILRGVGPWTTDHEYYFKQYFRPDDKRVVPILTTMMPSDAPQRHVIAWCVEREGGGRGFAFTGGHYHKNMMLQSYRRMILGAILWTAKMPIPEGGVVSSVDTTAK